MFKGIRRRPSPATVISIVALIVALAGTAVAGGVLNKKKVNKIITNRAPGLDVAHAKSADSAKSADTAKRADVATDADKVGGQGLQSISIARSVNPGGPACDPTSATFVDCATLSMTLPHEGQVLLIGTAGQVAFNNAQTQGDCLFRVDGANSGGSVHVGNQYAPTPTGANSTQFPNGFANTAVVGPVSAGAHSFSLACSETTSDIEFVGPQLSAVLVGSG